MTNEKYFAPQGEVGMQFLEQFQEALQSGELRSIGAGGAADGDAGRWLTLHFGRKDGIHVQFYACVCRGESGPVVRGGLFQGGMDEVMDQVSRFRERYNAI